ncbi:hypothetical protein [Fluviicola sp.]|uniref:hypothetical protein n=1 Tax=Fluviicola sp. TaxID=1917219 RepID=UPI0031CE667D
MKNKILAISILIIVGCTDQSKVKEIQIINEINQSIASEYKCQLTVDIINDQEKKLEISIQNSLSDDLLRGKMFVDYCSRLKSSGLQFQNYTLKENNEVVAFVSQEQLSRLMKKIEKDELMLSKLQKDRSQLYNMLDDSLKNEIDFNDFDLQLSKLDLKGLKFCGFIYFDTLMSISFENSHNRLSLVSDPNSDSEKLLGIQIK